MCTVRLFVWSSRPRARTTFRSLSIGVVFKVFVMCLPTARLAAQPSIPPGARIRLSIGPQGHRLTGVFQELSRDSITFRRGGAINRLSFDDIRSFERSLGRGGQGKKGAIIGLVASSALATAAVVYGTVTATSGTDAPSEVAFLLVGAAGAAGAGIGFIIGSGFRWETWQSVALSSPTTKTSGRLRGLQLGFQIQL
jgi:hypothetical protein